MFAHTHSDLAVLSADCYRSGAAACYLASNTPLKSSLFSQFREKPAASVLVDSCLAEKLLANRTTGDYFEQLIAQDRLFPPPLGLDCL